MRKAIILMNDMRGKAENVQEIDMAFPDRQAAIDYINSQKVEPYQDEPSMDDYGHTHGYSKTFKKGSPLEWFNPLSESQMQGDLIWNQGIVEIEEVMSPQWRRVS